MQTHSSDSHKDLVAWFSSLPNEDDNNYTRELKSIVIENNLFDRIADIEDCIETGPKQYCFSAFYSLLIICRELNYYSKYNSYVEKYASRFEEFKLYSVVMSTYYRNKGILGEKDKFKFAIRFAEEACETMPTNLAVKHHFAAMVVISIEENTSVDVEIIEKAIHRLDDVILAYPNHAPYYFTQGRLLAAMGNYQQGIENVKRAINLEEVADKDSMIRIGQYNYHLLQIKMMQENEEIDKRMGGYNSSFQEVKNDLDNIKTQHLEYLAFFSSILAFILATVNIAVQINDFNMCAGILLMFTGMLIISFTVFRVLLYFSSKKKQWDTIIVCCITGIVFIVVGFLVGKKYIFF